MSFVFFSFSLHLYIYTIDIKKTKKMSFAAAPGVLQLQEKCRVFDRQYIKCVIRASTIARAVQNGYPVRFEFNEISHS